MILSIVTICFNDLKGLKETVNSVSAQKDQSFEFVIVDGASTDGTIEYLKTIQSFKNFRFISEKDKGVYDAMNKGIHLANGDYTYFLNAGDSFSDGKVTADLSRELSVRSPDVLYAKVICEQGDLHYEKGKQVSSANFIFGMPLSHQGIIYKSSLIKKTPYDTSYRIIADYKLTKQIFKNSAVCIFLDRKIAKFDLGGISSTAHLKLAKERLRLSLEEKDWVSYLYCVLILYPKYALITLLKKLGVYHLVNSIRHRTTS